MAKDPALLWYWSDWRGGTATFTRHLKGCYMDLLDAQFNSGALSLEEIRIVLGADFGQVWPTLQKKFTLTNSGLFYNKRMEEEREKRKKFTESRRKNLTSVKDPPHMGAHVDSHMAPHMENENVITNPAVPKGGMGGARQPIVQAMMDAWQKENSSYPADLQTDFQALFDIGQFIAGQLRGKWLPETDVGHMAVLETWSRLSRWILADDFYKSWALAMISTTKNLQTIWLKSKEQKNGTKPGIDAAGKPGTSEARVNAARNF